MKQSMVLLHGLFGGLSNWNEVITHFQSTYDIHIPALPVYEQHGRDQLGHLTSFLEFYIDNHKLDNMILVGNSLGGHAAILYTHRHPQKVSRLILTGSSGLYENTSIGSFPKRSNYDFIRERVAYTFYDPAIATAELVDEVFGVTTDARKCLAIVRMAKSAQRHYVADLLQQISTPTLLIWGEDDLITPLSVAKEFESLLPNAKLVKLPQCGHAPMMEKPEAFNKVLQEYLTLHFY
jgi:pimeloyl-ACP methyl ester carboxylesterase